MKSKAYIAIDPGRTGAAALITDKGSHEILDYPGSSSLQEERPRKGRRFALGVLGKKAMGTLKNEEIKIGNCFQSVSLGFQYFQERVVNGKKDYRPAGG